MAEVDQPLEISIVKLVQSLVCVSVDDVTTEDRQQRPDLAYSGISPPVGGPEEVEEQPMFAAICESRPAEKRDIGRFERGLDKR